MLFLAENAGKLIPVGFHDRTRVERCFAALAVLREIRKADLMDPDPRVKGYDPRAFVRPARQRTLGLYSERLGVSVAEFCRGVAVITELTVHQERNMQSTSAYTRFAKSAAQFCGRPSIFSLAAAVIVVWLVTGPIFGFSDTWQLVINTGTTIVTFLMVFLIQNTQNRDTEAIQLKLDELIRATKGAHNALLDLEELDEEALACFKEKYQALAKGARTDLDLGNKDTGSPEP